MPHFTKDELLKNAAPYFSQGEKVMYATSDGNYFYAAHKHYAENHKKTVKVELHELTKEDFEAQDNGETADEKLQKAEKALEKANKALEKAKTPEAKDKAELAVLEAQEVVDKLKAEIEGQ